MASLRRVALLFASALVALAALALTSRRAEAQGCLRCSDVTAPTITFSPDGGSYSGSASTYSLPVTIGWCDDFNLSSTSAAITLNCAPVGGFVYATGTKTGCKAYAQSTGTVTPPAGTNLLRAQIRDLTGKTGTSTTSYTYSVVVPPTYTVTVDPHGGAVNAGDRELYRRQHR